MKELEKDKDKEILDAIKNNESPEKIAILVVMRIFDDDFKLKPIRRD